MPPSVRGRRRAVGRGRRWRRHGGLWRLEAACSWPAPERAAGAQLRPVRVPARRRSGRRRIVALRHGHGVGCIGREPPRGGCRRRRRRRLGGRDLLLRRRKRRRRRGCRFRAAAQRIGRVFCAGTIGIERLRDFCLFCGRRGRRRAIGQGREIGRLARRRLGVGRSPPIQLVGSTQSGMLEQALAPKPIMATTAKRVQILVIPSVISESLPRPCRRHETSRESIYRDPEPVPSRTLGQIHEILS